MWFSRVYCHFGFLSAIITGQYSFVASGGIALVVSYSLFKGLHNKIFEKKLHCTNMDMNVTNSLLVTNNIQGITNMLIK